MLRCHIAAFDSFGGVPEQILYDRMKTAVLGEIEDPDQPTQGIAYNPKLLSLASHYGFLPKACKPYRAKTKGKVERPFRYVREDFFLARSFRNLEDLNIQFTQWLDQLANRRRHATTQRIVAEHFAEERPHLKPLPAGPFNSVLALERRVTRDGMVSVGGNLYSVPDCTRRRTVEVQVSKVWSCRQRYGCFGLRLDGAAAEPEPGARGVGYRPPDAGDFSAWHLPDWRVVGHGCSPSATDDNANCVSFRHSFRSRPLKLSRKPFRIGWASWTSSRMPPVIDA